VLAAASGLAAFYILEVKPELASRQSAQITQTMQESEPKIDVTRIKVEEVKVEPGDELNLKSLIEKSVSVHGKEEADRSEGSLWYDKKASRYVVTLGGVNGVLPGTQLGVYRKDKRVGSVTVDTAFDVISYVTPSSNLTLGTDYYRVLKE